MSRSVWTSAARLLILSVLLALVLVIVAGAGTQLVTAAASNSAVDSIVLGMPEEYLNYTIARINGTLWSKIDGVYPMYVTYPEGKITLPMLYPTPPNTTNIQLKLDNTTLSWSNYTGEYPYALHHTAIGDWSMIYCLIEEVPRSFVLAIHYEHPVEQVNGVYTFLYDLNISPYLSPHYPNSTAHFNIRFEMDYSDSIVNVYTTETDTKWNSINFTTVKNSAGKTIMFDIFSEQSRPLAGDIAVTLTDTQITESPPLPIAALLPILGIAIIALIVAMIVNKSKRKKSAMKSDFLEKHKAYSTNIVYWRVKGEI